MERKIVSALVVLLVIGQATTSLAGPPTIGSRSGGSTWYNPTTWSWPSLPWSSEPPRIRKKSQGMMTDMNQSAKRNWAKTKAALDPSKMFVSDPKPQTRQSKPGPGLWESMFGTKETKQEVRTVNDFLSQPHPR